MDDSSLTACTEPRDKFEAAASPTDRLDFKANFKVMLLTFFAGVGLMCLKFYGFWITGSSAILSDALESIINVVASGFGLVSIWISAIPADESHPYGHGKIEFFSAGFEGAMIIIAAGGIFFEGVRQILSPQDLPNLEKGLIFLLVAGLGNLVLGLILLRTGRRTKSLVLEADGKHLLTDFFTSGAVLLGLVVVYFSLWYRFDGVIACIAGINIVFWGWGLVKQGFGELMHTSDPELLDEICDLLSRHKKTLWIDVHRLRAWRSGKLVHVDFHLILPRDLPLEQGHREVKELEEVFSRHFDGMSDLLIHLDPCLDPECPVCGLTPCDLRQHSQIHQKIWSRQALTTEINDNH